MLRPGQIIILCVVALLSLGVVLVTSAGLTVDPDQNVNFLDMISSRAVLYALLALVVMTTTSLVPGDRVLSKPRFAGWIILVIMILCTTLLLLVYLPGVGKAVNGSHRWVQFGSFSFQPSEIAKWGMLVVLAAYLGRTGNKIRRFFSGLLPAMMIVALLCGLIILEDLGTAVLMGAAGFLVIAAAGARLRYLALLSLVGAAVCFFAVTTSAYRMKRLTAFMDPYADPDGAGYHMIQSEAAISAGKITGRGLGYGLHKFGYLPEDTTDFLFAIACEELGVAGATLITALYGGLLLAGWSIVVNEKRRTLRLLGLGIIMTIGLQAVMNMMVVTGLAPTKGIALPLMSWGGSGWIMGSAALGILIRMDRVQAAQQKEYEVDSAPREHHTVNQSHAVPLP